MVWTWLSQQVAGGTRGKIDLRTHTFVIKKQAGSTVASHSAPL